MIFSETVLCRELGFFALRSVHQDASFELSKTVIGQFFKFVIIRRFRGVKKLPCMEKKFEKNFPKKISYQGAKRNKKMGGRSYVITFGAIGTLYCAINTVHWT